MLTSLFILQLFLQTGPAAPEPILYGDLFLEETRDDSLPKFFLNVGYAIDTSGVFVDLPAVNANLQFGVHEFVSTGIMAQWMFPQLSSSAESLAELREIDIHFEVSKPQWSIFSLTQIKIFLGQWNLLNLSSFRVEMLAGGGFGFIKRKEHFSAKTQNQFSYLWHIEQRFRFFESWGLQVALLGHRGAVFLQPGASFSF